jgi:hypothetical protein
VNAVARMAVLDLRSVAPYRNQGLTVFALVVVLLANRPVVIVPALMLLVTGQFAAYPFNVADKAGLETLYAVLPVPRRTVLYGHYAWALGSFVATATVGTALAVIAARVQSLPLGGHAILSALTVAWALFAVNVAVQFPLLIRFGYTRISVLGTVLPLALVMIAVIRLHLNLTRVEDWPALLWAGGAAALAVSVVMAQSITRRARPKVSVQ